MSDRGGLNLAAGDPVLYCPGNDENGLTATVLRVVSPGRYAIQLDGVCDRGQWDLLQMMKHGPAGDLQDAFEVDGATLVFMGEMEWGDDEDGEDDEDDEGP